MAAVAVTFLLRPIKPFGGGSRSLASLLVVGTVALSAGLYTLVGSPDTPSGAGAPRGADADLPDISTMVANLAARLKVNPDDIEGFRMLGRSYMQLANYDGAVAAFERVVELDGGQSAQSLVALGEAHVARNNQQLSVEAVTIFENAVRIEPGNPAALFWSGIAAANQGDTELAATRWETLLNTPPAPTPEVANVLRQRIAEWRGVAVADAAPAAGPTAPSPGAVSAAIDIAVGISEEARNNLPQAASVFIIARDPKQPSPPIAVQRRVLSELPANVTLSDSDSMIPGRNLSGFAEVEIVVRASASGNPIPQSGDWFASSTVPTSGSGGLSLTIAERVE